MAKVITIAQQKGGAGKTTLTLNLALALTKKGYRVAIIDIDPQKSLSHWHKIREQKMGEGYTGLQFVQASGWRVTNDIARLKSNVDFILIDSPPHTETDARTAIKYADLLVIPVQPSPTDIWATEATTTIADQERVTYCTILNRVPVNSKLAKKSIGALKNLLDTQVGNRVAFATAMEDGKGVLEIDPFSHASEEIKQLTEELLNKYIVEVKITEILEA